MNTMEQEVCTAVAIKDVMRRSQPFDKLPSKNITAIILSYSGRRDEVCQLLQKLNHAARAYCIQQNGLKGFLVGYPSYFKHLSPEARTYIVKIEKDRFCGKLLQGRKRLEGDMYVGEVDSKGNATGKGTWTKTDGKITYEATWLKNKRHGVRRITGQDGAWVTEGEVKHGKANGKQTEYE